jgi:hypothetical protein
MCFGIEERKEVGCKTQAGKALVVIEIYSHCYQTSKVSPDRERGWRSRKRWQKTSLLDSRTASVYVESSSLRKVCRSSLVYVGEVPDGLQSDSLRGGSVQGGNARRQDCRR